MKRTFLLLFASLSALCSRAEVKLPAIFGDHMVLQQDAKLPVWGTADPGEKIVVTLGARTVQTTADAAGQWRVELPSTPASAASTILNVAGKNTIKFEDVLIGDVWVASGQSNMEFPLSGAHTALEDIPKANDPQLRLFNVAHITSAEPKSEVAGRWEICTPQTVGAFSAVAYYFGRELRSVLQRPIGLIGSSWGGTPAQSWVSLPGLEKVPAFSNYVQQARNNYDSYLKLRDDYPRLLAEYQAAKKQWDLEVKPSFDPVLKDWVEEANRARAAGQPQPARPQPARSEPAQPRDPNPGPGQAASLYNGMIAPLIPYAIQGAIWYQGESNAPNAVEYDTLFPRMITDWREKWGQGDFPFLFVELARYEPGPNRPDTGKWARLREAQVKTLALPHTGMASAVDIGNPRDIHPKDKKDVGLRLAQAARHVAYGQSVVPTGPLYSGMKIEGDKVRLSFQQVGSGLMIAAPPWVPDGMAPPSTTELTGFTIAGADLAWFPAKARIENQTVVVWSDQVPKPAAVRCGWSDAPEINLYNKEGLPASPFRTDNWPNTSKADDSPSRSGQAMWDKYYMNATCTTGWRTWTSQS